MPPALPPVASAAPGAARTVDDHSSVCFAYFVISKTLCASTLCHAYPKAKQRLCRARRAAAAGGGRPPSPSCGSPGGCSAAAGDAGHPWLQQTPHRRMQAPSGVRAGRLYPHAGGEEVRLHNRGRSDTKRPNLHRLACTKALALHNSPHERGDEATYCVCLPPGRCRPWACHAAWQVPSVSQDTRPAVGGHRERSTVTSAAKRFL